MRRFSQRNHLVTLSDINITPLLDLAFVLLIIFVITTPLLEQSLKLELPGGGLEDKAPKRREDVKTVEIARDGTYVMAGKKMSLNEVEATLVQAFKSNPKLGVIIRGDAKAEYEMVTKVLNVCQQNQIFSVNFSTHNEKR
jgi:biopolymer transport protein ExbD